MTDKHEGRDQAIDAVLSVFLALEMGAGNDVAVANAFAGPVKRIGARATARAKLTLDPDRRAGGVGAAFIEGMSEVVGDHIAVSVALLAELARVTGRPPRELIDAVRAQEDGSDG